MAEGQLRSAIGQVRFHEVKYRQNIKLLQQAEARQDDTARIRLTVSRVFSERTFFFCAGKTLYVAIMASFHLFC